MMKPTVHASKRLPTLRRHPRGFALIVTLSLMILLTVIAVGLLSLSSISLRASSSTAAQQQAKANARLALMLAVGQMQQMTGPDQRVTALADQRPKNPDGKETSAADGNRHWTGVYRSWPTTLKDRPSPEFVSWLVSGNPVDAAKVMLPDTKLPDPTKSTGVDVVELVGTGTLGTSTTTGKVWVPALKIQQNGKPAKLAWWVGDQGMKAAISAPVPPTDTTFGAIRNRLQGAPRNAFELAAAGALKPFAAIDPVDPRLGSIPSWQSAGFLAADPKGPQPLFHDLAPFSTGLLTNVAAGGFRKDLSLRLERLPTGTGNNAPPDPTATALYTVGNEPGINLNELWVYYNSYKDIKRSGTYKFTTSGQLANQTPFMLVESSPDACATDYEFFLKQPTVISYQMVLSLQAFPVAGTALNRVHLVSDPIVTLWNPLDIPVVIPQSSFISVKYWQVPYSINVKVNGIPVFNQVPLAASLSGQLATDKTDRDQNYLSIQLGTSQAEQIVLKPGEVVKFSQSGGIVRTDGFGSTKNSLIAKKGFNYNGGFAIPLKDLGGKTVDLKVGDQITYEAFANKITAGKTSTDGNSVSGANAHSRHFSITHHEVYVGRDRGSYPSESLGYGNMSIDWDFGNRRLKQGETRGDTQQGTKPSNERIYADGFQQFFQPVSGQNTRPLTVNALVSNKSPFLLLTYDAKTDLGSESATRSLTRFNPKAHHVDFYELTAAERDRMPYEFRAEPMVNWVNRSLDLSPDGSGFFGGGMNGQTGTSQVTTHSIPREPIVSLAAFQHSFANGFVHPRPTVGYGSINAREPMLPQISHAIGNSMAPAMLAPDKTEGTYKGTRPVADHSYLANRALWDDYFLSGVAPQELVTYGKLRDQKTVATGFFTKDPALFKPLPVVRYKADLDGEEPSALISSFFTATNPTDTGFLNLASYLRVDGLFNINSTSEQAWMAMLGSLKGRQIIVRDATGKESIAPANATAGGNIPVTSLQNPQNLMANGSGSLDTRDPSQWVGRRELSETELSEIAKALVSEIRKRGPFLSLADFVNRRVGSDKDLARAGALQSALDSSTVGVNKAFGTVGPAAARFEFPEAEKGQTSFGIPGIVKQADLLTPIAPVLSARSDSFVIRAYGESVDAAGKITARAWCEAVVERDRNFIDPTNKATTALASLNPINTKFGRRYEIISFRWLSSSEV